MNSNADVESLDKIVKFRKLNDTTHFSSSNSSTDGMMLDNSNLLSGGKLNSTNQRLSRKNQLKLSNSKFKKILLATTHQFEEVLSPIPDNPGESPYRPCSQDGKDQRDSENLSDAGQADLLFDEIDDDS